MAAAVASTAIYVSQDAAWREGHGVEGDALWYLMGAGVQGELEAFVLHARVTSMLVEGKHHFVKASETQKISGCSVASRNGIIRRYLVERTSCQDNLSEAVREHKTWRHSSIWSIAQSRNPDLVTRPRGKRKWEDGVTKSQMREIVHRGDEAALAAYVALHRDELEAELASGHQGRGGPNPYDSLRNLGPCDKLAEKAEPRGPVLVPCPFVPGPSLQGRMRFHFENQILRRSPGKRSPSALRSGFGLREAGRSKVGPPSDYAAVGPVDFGERRFL